MSEITWAELTEADKESLRYLGGYCDWDVIPAGAFESLTERGLASVIKDDDWYGPDYAITDLGRAVLAQAATPDSGATGAKNAQVEAGKVSRDEAIFYRNARIDFLEKEWDRHEAELASAKAEAGRLRAAATRAYNCLDTVYETFDGDLGNGLSQAIPRVCEEIKAALQAGTEDEDDGTIAGRTKHTT